MPANPVILDGVPDLTGLTYLNEPSILHGLNLRYSEDLIYTHAGPVLIAINPFKQASNMLRPHKYAQEDDGLLSHCSAMHAL